jgi:hypothetical protein
MALMSVKKTKSRRRNVPKQKSKTAPEFKNPFDKIRRAYTKQTGSRSNGLKALGRVRNLWLPHGRVILVKTF